MTALQAAETRVWCRDTLADDLDALPPLNRVARRRGLVRRSCSGDAVRVARASRLLTEMAEKAHAEGEKQKATRKPRKPTAEAVLGSAGIESIPATLDPLVSGSGFTANDLTLYGWGGGYGPNGVPFGGTSPDFQYNMGRLAKDVVGTGAVLRLNLTADYSQQTDKWQTWNFGVVNIACAIADMVGCSLLLSVNVKSPTTSDKVPKIDAATQTMLSWKQQWTTQILPQYCGPNAVVKPTFVVSIPFNGGSVSHTMSSGWVGRVMLEVWNEPQSIGSCGNTLTLTGHSQGLPGPKVVYMLNRDALAACQSHSSWGTFKLAAITMGGLHGDYLIGTAATPGVLRYAAMDSYDWYQGGNGFHAFSMHCYMKVDPLVTGIDPGGTGPQGGFTNAYQLDSIRTTIRPGMNQFGAGGCYIWITEGGTGGSLSPSSGVEQWNVYNPTVGGVTPTGGGKVQSGDIAWGHMYGDPGANGSQGPSDRNQPTMLRHYVRKIRNMNSSTSPYGISAGVEMLCLHMLIRPVKLEGHMGDFPKPLPGALICNDATQGGQGNLEWQIARCFAELLTSPTDRNAYTNASTAHGTATISNASPGVATQTAHGLNNGDVVRFTTTGTLPAPLVPSFTYYVVAKTANTFSVALTAGGSAINTTSAGSGTHTLQPGSPDWLPVANHYHDEIVTGSAQVPTAPANVTPPSISDTTPTVGETLTCNDGAWSGVPTPTLSRVWIVNGVDTTQTGQTFTVPLSAQGLPVAVRVLAANASGTSSLTTANTSNVAPAGGGAPVNQTVPGLSDAQGALGGANAPNQGAAVVMSDGTWSPDGTKQYKWEKTTDGGATWTTI